MTTHTTAHDLRGWTSLPARDLRPGDTARVRGDLVDVLRTETVSGGGLPPLVRLHVRDRAVSPFSPVEDRRTWTVALGTGHRVHRDDRPLAERDASLGVGHVWTATSCPAYRSLLPAECTCRAGSCPRTGRSSSVCVDPSHESCPVLRH